tara:strand:- start:18 stop:458 length:441 start_codon:yes stop_codon:yes gene_type:complete
MSILNFLFPDSKIIKETKKEAKIILKEFESIKGATGMNGTERFIKPPIFNLLNDKKKHTQFQNHLVDKGITPKVWILRSVCAAAFHTASSGHNHLHRGFLSPMSGADTLPKIFIESQKKLVELNDLSKKSADENYKTLNQNILAVG